MKKITKIIVFILITLLILTGLFFLIRDLIDPIKNSITSKSWDILVTKFSEYGFFAYFIIAFIQALLILITFIPVTILQVIAGIVLNPYLAFLTLLVGVFLGNVIMWYLVKKYEKTISKYYNKKIKDLDEIKEERKISKKIILLYFLPVISYGLIAYTLAKSKMKFLKYISITTLGTIPSIIISISLGQLIVDEKLVLVLIIVLLIFSILTMKYSKYIQKLFTKKPKKDMSYFQNNVKKPHGFIYWFFKNILKFIYFRKVNLKVKNQEIFESVEGPFLLLYNHPSFFDWLYSFIPLYPKKINAIMAYYYFCNYKLGRFLHMLGCFPKFLYQPDISAIKNIKKVIKQGGILGIAPEGRLSAYGCLETLAPATEKLVKHLNIPVYLAKINGGYFTYPKWAKKIRRGRVDLEYELIFTVDDLNKLSLDEIKNILYEKMNYDDFAWNEKNKVYFKAKKIAEGLENMLYVCPKCHSEFTITAKDNKLTCNHCGLDVTLNNYYKFESTYELLPKTIKEWYLFQKQYEDQNVKVEKYCLTDNVTLKLPDPKGKGFSIVGSGVATLTIEGLKYEGTINGNHETKIFKIQNIPAIPFGANENFEVYHDNTLYYFIPTNPRYSVKWSVVGESLYKKYLKENNQYE